MTALAARGRSRRDRRRRRRSRWPRKPTATEAASTTVQAPGLKTDKAQGVPRPSRIGKNAATPLAQGRRKAARRAHGLESAGRQRPAGRPSSRVNAPSTSGRQGQHGRPRARARLRPLATADVVEHLAARSGRRQAGDRRSCARRGHDEATELRRHASPIRSRASWSNGRSCAATTTTSTSPATSPSSPPIRAGRASAALRRRAEATLWQERPDPQTVAPSSPSDRPLTAKGRFALARALLAQGDRAGAQALCAKPGATTVSRPTWKARRCEVFGGLITAGRPQGAHGHAPLCRRRRGRHCAPRNRLGGNALAIAKARIAVIKKAAQRQGAARRRAGRGAQRPRLHLQPHPMAAPRRQDRRSRRS